MKNILVASPISRLLPKMSQTTQAFALALFLFFQQSCTLTIQGDKDLPTPCENGLPTYCHRLGNTHCDGIATYNFSNCEPKTTSVCFSTQWIRLSWNPITYTIYNSSGQPINQIVTQPNRWYPVIIPVWGRITVNYTANTTINQGTTSLHFLGESSALSWDISDNKCE